MVEFFQKNKFLNRSSKPNPLMNMMRPSHQLGSGLISPIHKSKNDPYTPHIPKRSHSSCSQKKQRPVRRSTNSSAHVTQRQEIHHHHHHYYLTPISPSSSRLSPPPLSPTRPSWREIKRSPTWHPASSISSCSSDDDDEPLGLQYGLHKPFSLLSDAEEDGDDELIPIARLSISSSPSMMSAAEKYKAKVRAKLQMNDTSATNM